ncbi:hypothetical protein CBR_g40861 [Chara braunii]|uniref:Uncharacterized protein n=1 Tax=Chara braunii TaxID=69332 RepID=A0A388K279_CHABU|nr:hypothetical protein CBR_g40861 [Chara braunii]|eukprot:GBG64162.1 hypothetical protein CBR_g40861 [Chara braunii]
MRPPGRGQELQVMEREGGKQVVQEGAEAPSNNGEGNGGSESKGDESGNKKKAPEALPGVSYLSLYRFADSVDALLILLGTLGAVGTGAGFPVFFIFFGKMVDKLGGLQSAGSANRGNLVKETEEYVLYFVYLAACLLVSLSAQIGCWTRTAERQTAKIRVAYLKAVLSQEIGYFDTQETSSRIVTGISNDVVVVQEAISEKVGLFIQFFSAFVAGYVIGFKTSWRLAVVILGAFPGIIIAGGLYTFILSGLSSKSQAAYDGAGNVVLETLSSIRTVYSFVGEESAKQLYSRALSVTCKLGIKMGFVKGIGLGVMYGVLFCIWGLVFWRASIIVSHRDATAGDILTTMFNVVIGGMSLGQALPYVSSFVAGKTAGYKVFSVIERKPLISSEDKKGEKFDNLGSDIELRSVNFAYPSRPDSQILRDFSVTIPAGKTVALVGSSGSGKSTIIGLVERFYEPSSGQVLIGGHDIKKMQLRWLRRQIGLVSQEPALFATSIRENILYGKAGASTEEVEAAAKAANAHKFIMDFPEGYDTLVGESGVQMSGGQKQRIAIARAILKNPIILLLDEATSALDSESERVVQDALDGLMIGRTTVVVAHRLSTIRGADKIVVMQAGEIVEEGSHDELMSKGANGVYTGLVRLQNSNNREEQEGDPRFLSDRGGQGWSMSQRTDLRSSSKLGRLSFSLSHLSDASMVEPGKFDADRKPIDAPSFMRLLKMNLPEWKWALIGVVGSLLSGVYNPSFALIIAQVLDAFMDNNTERMKEKVLKYVWVFLGLGGSAFFVYAMNWGGWGGLGENLVKRVRELFFASVLRQEIGWFDRDENNSGAIASRLESDATIVKSAVADRLAVMMGTASVMIISTGISFYKSWRLALVSLVVFPLLLIGNIAQGMTVKGVSKDARISYARAGDLAAEAVVNIRTVQAFSAEDKILALFRSHVMEPFQKNTVSTFISAVLVGSSTAMMFGSFALLLWYAMRLIQGGVNSFNDVFTAFMVAIVAAFAVAEVLSLAPETMKGGGALAAIFSTVDRQTMIDPDEPGSERLPKIAGMVELRRVKFHYPSRPDVPVFSDFSLRINPGQTVALVGPSGSGKSSVISLIERFYDPLSGKVLIDGKDIKTLNLKWLRGQIGLVSQEPALFAWTIKQNILYGMEGASESEVIDAAKAANAHNFISSFADGYNTLVGEKGTQMSGGQKQRIAIARAVLKNPRILLLDEATSALDTESERIVQDALDKLMVGRTTVVIAHRLSTIRNVDLIAVVQQGSVVEIGNHDALESKGGVYAALLALQKN